VHISDGIVDAPVSAAFGAVALAGVTYCAYRARRELDEKTAPMAGLVAAFVFAVQMLNFAVLPGVSGHLLGGALATILVGPAVGALCVSVVLIVQALLFADGGLTALGLNITNMALVGSAVAGVVVVALLRVLPRSKTGLLVASFVTALLSVLAGASMFVLEYWLGGTLELSMVTVASLQLGYHLLIGLGEGVITALTVWTVAQVRPDLVWALRRSGWRLATDAPPQRAAVTGSAS
jgi:cobalt/nickel transport system permease protein